MPFMSAENTVSGRKLRQLLLAGVASGVLLLGSGFAYVSAQEGAGDDGLDAIFAAEDVNACTDSGDEAGALDIEDADSENACGGDKADTDEADAVAAGDEPEEEEIDLGMDDSGEDASEALSDEDEEVLSTLSDEEADEVATLFDEDDADGTVDSDEAAPDMADDSDMAAADDAGDDDAAAGGDESDMGLEAGGDEVAAGPGGDGDGDTAASGGDGGDSAVDTADAGSDSAAPGEGAPASGSLVAVGVGDGLSNAMSDPTSLDSLADVVVGTDPENGNKDNVAQVTALGGVTNGGNLGIAVLEVINGDTEDPLGQVLLIDADNPPAPGSVPSIDGIAEINVGDDPDGQTFNVIQVDVVDDNFLPDGSASLANVSVGDGLDDGFGSLVGISIAENNNGENDDLANIALGEAFDPLAEPLSPLTSGVNDLGLALGAGLAPVLGPLGAAIP